MSKSINFDTPAARVFFEAERRLAMAELHLGDDLSEEEKYHRWRAVKLAVQFLKTAVDSDVLSVDQLVGAIKDDRYL